ncbi:MAG: hypothetical protein ACE141_12650 [Bryobacteraceae bacterium]
MPWNSTQHVRANGLVPAALLAFGLACSLPPTVQPAEPGPRLVVAIRDYAGVPQETLDAAEAQLSKIFGKAGVPVEWWELPPLGSAAVDPVAVKPALYVMLLSDSMAARLGCSLSAFGFALADRVYIFADRTRQAAAQTESNFTTVLGLAMAHEVGHVLLGPNGHAPGNVMTPRFGKTAFQQGERGALLFLPDQAERMREQVRNRLSASERAQAASLLANR